ncbi:hypothetical protein F4604DRAFT_1682344 [Suillus subluteus]|nr:hypothetical protein F4604DRAFT_1682344 [Suillus subluteus]
MTRALRVTRSSTRQWATGPPLPMPNPNLNPPHRQPPSEHTRPVIRTKQLTSNAQDAWKTKVSGMQKRSRSDGVKIATLPPRWSILFAITPGSVTCIKLEVPCIVLPDKKFRHTRLTCANCDEMKITCAIDSASVQQRLQAKAKSESALAKVIKPSTRSSTRTKQTDDPLNDVEARQQVTKVLPDLADTEAAQKMQLCVPLQPPEVGLATPISVPVPVRCPLT